MPTLTVIIEQVEVVDDATLHVNYRFSTGGVGSGGEVDIAVQSTSSQMNSELIDQCIADALAVGGITVAPSDRKILVGGFV